MLFIFTKPTLTLICDIVSTSKSGWKWRFLELETTNGLVFWKHFPEVFLDIWERFPIGFTRLQNCCKDKIDVSWFSQVAPTLHSFVKSWTLQITWKYWRIMGSDQRSFKMTENRDALWVVIESLYKVIWRYRYNVDNVQTHFGNIWSTRQTSPNKGGIGAGRGRGGGVAIQHFATNTAGSLLLLPFPIPSTN